MRTADENGWRLLRLPHSAPRSIDERVVGMFQGCQRSARGDERMSFRCWLVDQMDESEAFTVEDAWEAHDAASEACSHWSDGGTFAGDDLGGDDIDVHVRDADGVLWRVSVIVSWDPSFYGCAPVRVEEPETPEMNKPREQAKGEQPK